MRTPERAAGFPNTFVQATRVGTPIASLSVDADDIIRQERIGVVGDDTVAVLAARIDELLADAPRWDATSEAARRVFAERHDLSAISARFTGMVVDVAVDRAAPRRTGRP